MLRSWMKAISIVITVVAMMALPLYAQQNTVVTGGLNGTVIDSTGAAVAGATVTITGPQGEPA